MRKVQLDLTPDTHIVQSIRRTDISYPEAVSELVDNSLDQGSTNIQIDFDGKQLTVADNGAGCDDLTAMLRLGSHKRTGTTRLGRYGVGLKNAAIGLGDILKIQTVKDGVERIAEIDWQNIQKWSGIDSSEQDTNKANGTAITISQLQSPRPKFDRLISALAYTFAPAIWNGKRIAIKSPAITTEIEAWQLPKMKNRIVERDSARDTSGQEFGYQVTAGIVEQNDREPFVLSYEHRILCGTSEPCSLMRSSSRFFAFVELHGRWPLLKHKDGIGRGAEAEWLYESLYQVCYSLLDSVQKDGEALELQELEAELEMALGMSRGRQRRPGSADTEGAVAPVGTDRKIREAAVVRGPGLVIERGSRASRSGISIHYDNLPDGRIGKVDVNSKRVSVVLNDSHPFISQLSKERDRKGLRSTCLALLAAQQAISIDPLQAMFKFEAENSYERFVEGFSKFTAALAAITDPEPIAG